MNNTKQLSIPCEVENESGLKIAQLEYEKKIKDKSIHPVFLVANIETKQYFVTIFFSKSYIESFVTFKVFN